MKLIHLPFQKNLNTYLTRKPIKGRIGVENIPVAYFNIINQVNGGYLICSCYPTDEPTEDGLNIVDISYLAGMFDQKEVPSYQIPSLLDQNLFRHDQDLAENELIFYEDQDRVAYFRYRPDLPDNQPEIWYQDFEIGQRLKLASTAQEFLSGLESRHLPLDHQSLHSYHRINREFLLTESSDELDQVFQFCRATKNKVWYFEWINYFLQSTHPRIRKSALNAMHYQEKHYPKLLPDNYRAGMNSSSRSGN